MSTTDWVVGISTTIIGSVILNFGINLQRFSHVREQVKKEEEQRITIKQPLWILGFALFLFGNILGFVGLSFASQSVVAPLSSIALLSNCIFASVFLKESFTKRDFIATMVIIAGSVLIVVFGSRESGQYTVGQLVALYLTPHMYGFIGGCLGLIAILIVIQLLAERTADNPEHKYHNAANKFLPFSYPCTGAVLSSVSTLFAKGAGELLKTSIFQGNNQFINGETYVIVGIFAITAVSQLYFLNKSLKKYDTSYIVPVFNGVYTGFSITAGSLYFSEFNSFTPLQYGMFFLGVVVMFVGVIVLSQRLKTEPAPESGPGMVRTRSFNSLIKDDETPAIDLEDILFTVCSPDFARMSRSVKSLRFSAANPEIQVYVEEPGPAPVVVDRPSSSRINRPPLAPRTNPGSLSRVSESRGSARYSMRGSVRIPAMRSPTMRSPSMHSTLAPGGESKRSTISQRLSRRIAEAFEVMTTAGASAVLTGAIQPKEPEPSPGLGNRDLEEYLDDVLPLPAEEGEFELSFDDSDEVVVDIPDLEVTSGHGSEQGASCCESGTNTGHSDLSTAASPKPEEIPTISIDSA